MDILYVFNPENDLALASGLVNYTAPKNARKIRNDLQMLPLWIASEGDSLLVENNISNQSFLKDVQEFRGTYRACSQARYFCLLPS